ncbi:adenosine deaminase [Actinocrispum wychmicini]|uniref:Adenosine deaminase n=1 Tax=Actinocrispum wychmicini TaxID=1213861 RepID=A0A4R2IND2_9PSEU|nr:adenosine deaminase [Actinocrispum wychmicini]TCO46613.1 adenosine deaminase [Actinocrispum wychmicini]
MSDLRTLPKANLHLHLTGAMRPGTLAELADRYGLTVPSPIPPGARAWEEFQTRYDAAREAIRTTEDLRRVVTEAIEDNVADGCAWLEIQLDPTSYAPLLGGFEPVVEAALDGMRAAPCGLIIASSWARSGEHASQLALLANNYADVVGFGLSNDERRGKVDDFVDAARIAADKLRVPHGGFYEGPWHVRECVEKLGANRIGHGITAMRDKETVAFLADRGVALEVCPTSYPPLGVLDFHELPLRELLDAGVPVTLGSDDPLLFGAGVTDQYVIARDAIGLDDTELAAIARHSIEASAAPADLQARTITAISAWITARGTAADRSR